MGTVQAVFKHRMNDDGYRRKLQKVLPEAVKASRTERTQTGARPSGVRLEALYGGHLVKIQVVDSETRQALPEATVSLKALDRPSRRRQDPNGPKRIMVLRSTPSPMVEGRTDAEGNTYFALLPDRIPGDGRSVVASAVATSYGTAHRELQMPPPEEVAFLFRVDEPWGYAFEKEELPDTEFAEEIEIGLPRLRA